MSEHILVTESVIPVTAAQPSLLVPLPALEYLVELREYGPVYSTWSALEGELAEPLEGVSACIGNCSTALEELTDDMTEDFLPVLREYILYSDSMKVSWLPSCALRYFFCYNYYKKNQLIIAYLHVVQVSFILGGQDHVDGHHGHINRTHGESSM